MKAIPKAESFHRTQRMNLLLLHRAEQKGVLNNASSKNAVYRQNVRRRSVSAGRHRKAASRQERQRPAARPFRSATPVCLRSRVHAQAPAMQLRELKTAKKPENSITRPARRRSGRRICATE